MSEVLKIPDQSAKGKKKIIVALDVQNAQAAREIIAELKDEIGAFKIGLQLFTAAGASFVREVSDTNIKVFLDVKFHDIPNTVAKAALEVARLGVWMFNVHAGGGSEMMRKTVEEVKMFCEKENLTAPKIIGVTVLTSSNQKTLFETGVQKKIDEQVLNLANLTANCGLDGVVASPHEARLIRENIENKNFLIVTPGIRNSEKQLSESSKTATYEDQKRVMSATDAVRAGSDYLVIGRPILQAGNKISAVREIVKDLESFEFPN